MCAVRYVVIARFKVKPHFLIVKCMEVADRALMYFKCHWNLCPQCYRRILELEADNVQALHNLCVVAVERGKLAVAEECLTRAAALAPHEHYIQRHLAVVRARMQAATTPPPKPPQNSATPTATTEVKARWNYIPQQPPDPHETDSS